MRMQYPRNKKIVIYGSSKAITEAQAVLDTLDGLEGEMAGFRLCNEGDIRLIIQNAIDRHNIKAAILVDGNSVYPYQKIVRQYEKLKMSGKLMKMTRDFYSFLMEFDIAHYDIGGFIGYYEDDFAAMKKAVLNNAATPNWHTDLQRILDYIQGKAVCTVA